MTEARVGVGRVGDFRVGDYHPTFKITINGVDRSAGYVRIAGLSISDLLDGTPNTATLRVSHFTPVKGHEVKMALGSLDANHYLFCGHILTVDQVFELNTPTNVAYDLSCISYEWLLNNRTVTKKYTSTSATAIVLDLIASFTSGFATIHVASGLEALDEITFTNEHVTTCLDRLARRIGGYWYIDYTKDLHFFLTESDTAGSIMDGAVRTLQGLKVTTDLSPVRTRIAFEGGGSTALVALAPGETTLPVVEGVWYNASGGTVVSGAQRITYTGTVMAGGTGTTVAASDTRPSAPSVAANFAAGNLAGPYQYAVQIIDAVGTGGQLSAASASVSIPAVGAAPQPSLAVSAGGSINTGIHTYAVTFSTALGETGYDADNVENATFSGSNHTCTVTLPVSSDGRVTKRRIYRTEADAPNAANQFQFLAEVANNTTTTYVDTAADSALGGDMPTDDTTAGGGKVSVTSIPTGPAGTTARRLFRPTAGGSTYRLLTTIADNTTTTYSDNVTDGSLGAVAPMVTGAGTAAGTTTLPVEDLSIGAASGGWLLVANQLVRYIGRSASSGVGTFTGIPASGIGAIVTAIQFGAPVVVAPHLTGLPSGGAGAILYPIAAGDDVNLLVTVDDTAAQTALASLIGGDGIREDYFRDRRFSETESTAQATARLALVKDPLVTVAYVTRDPTTRSGRTVTFNLSSIVTGTFKIQSVQISGFDGNGQFFPTRRVEASSRRLTFESLLAQLRAPVG